MINLIEDMDGWGNVLPPPAWMAAASGVSDDTRSDDRKVPRVRELPVEDLAPEL